MDYLKFLQDYEDHVLTPVATLCGMRVCVCVDADFARHTSSLKTHHIFFFFSSS